MPHNRPFPGLWCKKNFQIDFSQKSDSGFSSLFNPVQPHLLAMGELIFLIVAISQNTFFKKPGKQMCWALPICQAWSVAAVPRYIIGAPWHEHRNRILIKQKNSAQTSETRRHAMHLACGLRGWAAPDSLQLHCVWLCPGPYLDAS